MKSIKEERESLEDMAAEIAKRLEVLQVLCKHEDIGLYYIKEFSGYKDTHYCKNCLKEWREN